MPYFPRKNPLVFPVSPSGTKRIRNPTGCDSYSVNGAAANQTAHFTGYMSLNPYYIPSNVSSIDIICQTYGSSTVTTAGTIQIGIYDANQGLENAFLTESTSFVSTLSTTTPYTNSLTLTKNYSEGWYIVAAVKTAGSSYHQNGYVRQAHILGKPVTTYPGVANTDMFYLSNHTTYITNQTSGLLQTMSSALSTGTYTAVNSNGSTPLAFLAY